MDETGVERPQPAAEPVVAIYPDGRVVIGEGYSVGQILQAVELARRAVLGIVPAPIGPPAVPKAE